MFQILLNFDLLISNIKSVFSVTCILGIWLFKIGERNTREKLREPVTSFLLKI